jgi:hypothetical protein
MSTLRTLSLSLFFLCFVYSLAAQDYHPFPQTNARWSGSYSGHHEEVPNTTQGFYYEIFGDTIIDGNDYQKLYYRPTWRETRQYVGPDELVINTYNDDYPLELVGALRQDVAAKKVYYRHFTYPIYQLCYYEFPTNEDFLLYDFDLDIGDLHPYIYGEMALSSIDSITLANGEMRKRYHFNAEREFIEGIGSTFGLFGLYAENFETSCYLQCLREEETYTYLSYTTTFECDSILVVGTTDLRHPLPDLKLFPNPFDHSIQVAGLDASKQNYQLVINNLLGEEVFRKTISFQESVAIPVPQLPAGAYIINIIVNPNIRVSRKLIKM